MSLRILGRAPIGHERQHRGRGRQSSPTCHIRFSSDVIDDHKRAPLQKHGPTPTTNRGTDACHAIWQAHPKRPASRVPPLQPISSSSWEPPRVLLSSFNHPWPQAFPRPETAPIRLPQGTYRRCFDVALSAWTSPGMLTPPHGFEPRSPHSKCGILPLDEGGLLALPTGIDPVSPA